MSGTGRPTYKSRKGTSNNGEYVPTKHVAVRDLPSHTTIKKRTETTFNKEEMLAKLQTLSGPRVAVHDADDFSNADTDSYSSSDSSSDESEDEHNDLVQELARMKKEKEEERRKAQEIENAKRNQLFGDQLISSTDYSMEVKWTDETLFQNQAADQPDKRGRYVNDPVRNDYHYKFLRKYLKT